MFANKGKQQFVKPACAEKHCKKSHNNGIRSEYG